MASKKKGGPRTHQGNGLSHNQAIKTSSSSLGIREKKGEGKSVTGGRSRESLASRSLNQGEPKKQTTVVLRKMVGHSNFL